MASRTCFSSLDSASRRASKAARSCCHAHRHPYGARLAGAALQRPCTCCLTKAATSHHKRTADTLCDVHTCGHGRGSSYSKTKQTQVRSTLAWSIWLSRSLTSFLSFDTSRCSAIVAAWCAAHHDSVSHSYCVCLHEITVPLALA